MKKITRVLMLFFAVMLFAVADSRAQVIVRVRPDRPREVVVRRPFRPSPRHVWVSEEWTPAGGAYAYHAGYWVVPPRPGVIWVPGHWRHHHGGFIWVAGFWR